jgi:hypothetical protein
LEMVELLELLELVGFSTLLKLSKLLLRYEIWNMRCKIWNMIQGVPPFVSISRWEDDST